MRKAKQRLRRGYRFASFAGAPAPNCRPFSPDVAYSVSLTLDPSGEYIAKSMVAVGESVERGQVIATFAELGEAPIHAPISGTVEAVDNIRVELRATEKGGGGDAPFARVGTDWEKLAPEELRRLIHRSGVTNVEAHGFPSATSGDRSRNEHRKSAGLIISIIDDDILNPAFDAILGGDGFARCAEGIRILAAAYPKFKVTVAVSPTYRQRAERFDEELRGSRIDTVLVSDRYPQSHPAILTRTIAGEQRRVRDLSATIATNSTVFDCRTPIHVFEAVVEGKPVLHRTIAVAGPAVKAPGHVDVLIGTPVAALVESFGEAMAEKRVIMDSIMTGLVAAEDEVITHRTKAIYCIQEAARSEVMSFASPGIRKDSYTNTFLAKFLPLAMLPIKKEVNTNIHGERRACLNCSYCTEVCPVEIMPNVLHRYVERDMISESLIAYGMPVCIDCNLCT